MKAYVKHNIDMEMSIKSFLLMFVGVSLLLFFFSILVFRSHLFKPINEIVKKSQKVSSGEYEISFEDHSNNELGTLKKALNNLFHKFREASTLVIEMGKGNFAYQLQIPVQNTQSDTFIQALEDTQSKLNTARQEEQNRRWVNEGVSKLGEIFRKNELELNELTKIILAELIEYIQANQGGVFILTEDKEEEYLDLVSCYAYNRKKYLRKRLEIGEGLIGETFLEGKMKFLKDIPDTYLEIKSGLGGANPNNLLLIPLKINDEVIGILEIASFQELEPHKIEFIQLISVSLASTISGKIKNEETVRLYHQAQQATEELRAAEEEMRQNMEELEATQEEMKRKESEYLKVIAQLQSNFKSNVPLSNEGIKDLN